MKKTILAIISLLSINMYADITPGITLTDTGVAVGKGSVSTGTGTIAIGNNSFASGDNLTKEEYDELIRRNNEKLREIEEKMNNINLTKEELNRLKEQNDEIQRQIRNLENLRELKLNKQNKLTDVESRYTEEIEIKKGESVSYRREIEDLERRLNIINTLDFNNLNEDNFDDGIHRLAIDLKSKMEEGKTFIHEYGENGIEIEKYEDYIKQYIAKPKLVDLEQEYLSWIYSRENNPFGPYTGSYDCVYFKSKKIDENSYFFQNQKLSNYLVDNINFESIKKMYYNFSETEYTFSEVNEVYDTSLYDINNNKFYRLNIIGYERKGSGLVLKIDKENPYVETNRVSIPQKDLYYKYKSKIVNKIKNVIYNEDLTTENEELKLNDNFSKFNQILLLIKNDTLEYKRINEKDPNTKTDTDYLKITQINNKYNYKNMKKNDEINEILNQMDLKSEFEKSQIYDLINRIVMGERIEYINDSDVTVRKDYINGYEDIVITWPPSIYTSLYQIFIDEDNAKEKLLEDNEVKNYLNKLVKMRNNIENNNEIISTASELGTVYSNEIERLKALERNVNDEINRKISYIAEIKNDISYLEEKINSISNENNNQEIIREIEEKQRLIDEKEEEIRVLKESLTNITVGENAIAYGTNSVSTGKNSVSFGTNNFVSGENSIGIGKNNIVYGFNSFAIGVENLIKGNGSGVFGDPNVIYSDNSYVIGNNNIVGTEENKTSDVFILGSNIDARKVGNAIVLGNNSEAVSNSLSIGSKGNERKIVNVADGEISESSKEAINGSQLYKVVKNISYGGINEEVFNNIDNNINLATASSIATASLPQVGSTKRFAIGFGSGMYQGAFSFAIGASGQELDTRLVYKMNVSINTKGKIGAGFGINYSFGDIERPIIRDNIDYSKEMLALYDEKEELGKRVKELEKKVSNSREVGIKVVGDYEVDKYILTEKQQEELDKMIKELEDRKIMITGYADIQGKDKYNLVLGLNRAVEVEKYLVSKGIKKENILKVDSLGYSSKIDKSNRLNRRVEILMF